MPRLTGDRLAAWRASVESDQASRDRWAARRARRRASRVANVGSDQVEAAAVSGLSLAARLARRRCKPRSGAEVSAEPADVSAEPVDVSAGAASSDDDAKPVSVLVVAKRPSGAPKAGKKRKVAAAGKSRGPKPQKAAAAGKSSRAPKQRKAAAHSDVVAAGKRRGHDLQPRKRRPRLAAKHGEAEPSELVEPSAEDDVSLDGASHVEQPLEYTAKAATAGRASRVEQPLDRSLPLRWGPDMLTQYCGRMLGNLSQEDYADIISFLVAGDGSQWNWSTACSGSESPHWAYSALESALSQREQLSGKFNHIFSAELKQEKRRWICFHSSPLYTYGDMFDVTRPSAKPLVLTPENTHREQQVFSSEVVAALGRWWTFLCGFSCKDASFLNRHVPSAQALAAGGTTSLTFQGSELIIATHRPPQVIFENVPGLCAGKGHLKVIQTLQDRGYKTFWIVSSSKQCSVPQDRKRLWMWGWLDEDNIVSQSDFSEHMEQAYDTLLADHPPMSLEDFLEAEGEDVGGGSASDGDEALQASSSQLQGRWRAKQSALYSKAAIHPSRTRWSSSLQDEVRAYSRLPERNRHQLDVAGVSFPDHRVGAVRIDQTNPGMHLNMCGTVTPGGSFWLLDRARLMKGSEKLALQCVHIDVQECEQAGFTQSFLHDIAGNAFNAASATAAILLSMLGRGFLERSARDARLPCVNMRDYGFSLDVDEVED